MLPCEERLRDLALSGWGKRRLEGRGGVLSMCIKSFWEGRKMREPGSSQECAPRVPEATGTN